MSSHMLYTSTHTHTNKHLEILKPPN